jgi:hypothetical protein
MFKKYNLNSANNSLATVKSLGKAKAFKSAKIELVHSMIDGDYIHMIYAVEHKDEKDLKLVNGLNPLRALAKFNSYKAKELKDFVKNLAKSPFEEELKEIKANDTLKLLIAQCGLNALAVQSVRRVFDDKPTIASFGWKSEEAFVTQIDNLLLAKSIPAKAIQEETNKLYEQNPQKAVDYLILAYATAITQSAVGSSSESPATIARIFESYAIKRAKGVAYSRQLKATDDAELVASVDLTDM